MQTGDIWEDVWEEKKKPEKIRREKFARIGAGTLQEGGICGIIFKLLR